MRKNDFKKSIKEIWTITKYSVLMFFREKTSIFFSLFIPVMLMGVFGLLNTTGSISYNVGIADEANNASSKQIVEAIKKVDVFNVSEGAKDEKLDELKNSKLTYVLVIPSTFGQVQSPPATRMPVSTAPRAPTKIDIYYDESQNAANIQVGFTIFGEIFDAVTHKIENVPVLFDLNKVAIGGSELRYIDFLVPGLVAMSVMQLSIFAATNQIVSWRERGILKRLLATPIRPAMVIFAQIVSRILITFFQASILILMGVLLFNLHIVGNIGIVIGLIILGGLIFLSMGFGLSGVSNTHTAVMAIAQVFIFPQMFLSGIFFPREGFPDWLNTITAYFPLTYFADAMREVMTRGADLAAIRGDLLGLFVWAIIMFIVAVKLFRWE